MTIPPTSSTRTRGRTMRILAAIGSLDSSHYVDERVRYIWYESSAVAVQLFLWGGYVIATAMIWTGSAAVQAWSVAVFGYTIAVSCCMLGYTKARRAEIDLTVRDYRSPTAVVAYLCIIAYVVGAFVALGEYLGTSANSGFLGGFRMGMLPGLIAGIALFVFGVLRQRRRAEPGEDDLD